MIAMLLAKLAPTLNRLAPHAERLGLFEPDNWQQAIASLLSLF